jgi:hypothetical protein
MQKGLEVWLKLALQERGPEFKPKSHQKKNNKKLKDASSPFFNHYPQDLVLDPQH